MIAFLISNLAILGGTTKQFLYLVEYADKIGLNFKIITQEVDYEKTFTGFRKFSDRIEVIPFHRKPGTIQSIYHTIIFALKVRRATYNVDIINFHDGSFTACLPFFRNKKVIWQINDLPYFFNVGVATDFKLSLKDKLGKYFLLFYKTRISEITVNVTKNAERVYDCLKIKAKVFYCGIEPSSITHDINMTLENIKKKRLYLLTSGIFFPYRNYETQISLVKILVDLGYDVKLNIIGSTLPRPEYAEKIKNLIKENLLDDRITICGQVDEDTFVKLHSMSDIFLFINIDQSWGLAVFEAMSCGLPVFISNSVGATEILKDNVNSIFVNPLDPYELSNKILNLINDEEKYKKIVENSLHFHKNYTWENSYCKKMTDLIQSL